MIGVRAFSRLHFGVLNVGTEAATDTPLRHFGGVGLMVHEPGLQLHVSPAADWSAEGPLAARALEFARCFADSALPGTARPMRLAIEHCAPEHAGLGTGTQLALAVARALAAAWDIPHRSAEELALRVGRGTRSGLGVHGFAQGGFLVEAGKRSAGTIAPLVARADFPDDWPLVLVLPPWGTGLHGLAEAQAFQHLNLQAACRARTEALCRLVLLGLLPALVDRAFAEFGQALYDFNRLVGETFAPVQGGVYASPRLEELVSFLRAQGVLGVAQSSWGPAIGALAEDEDRAADLGRRIRERFGLEPEQVFVTTARNRGAELTR